MTEDHARTPLPELEALLRRGNLPPERRQAVEAELDRRYAEKWRSSAASPAERRPPPEQPPPPPGWVRQPGPSYPPPGLGPGAAPGPGPAPGWVPPGPAAVTPPKKPGLAKPLGCLAAVLLAALAGVVIAILVDSESSPTIGTVCVTQIGTCPMADSSPVGRACVCRTPDGDIGGVVS